MMTLLMSSYAISMAQTEFEALRYIQTDINGTARYMGMAGAFGALGGDPSAIKDNPAGLGIYRRSEILGTLGIQSQINNSTWNGMSAQSDLLKFKTNNFSLVLASPTWKAENGKTGLLSSNFTFAYNKLKDFNRTLNIKSGNSAASMTDFLASFTGNTPSRELAYVNSPYYEPFDNTNVSWLSELAYEGKLMVESVDNNNSSWNSFLNSNELIKPAYQLHEKGKVDEYSFGWAGNFDNKIFLGGTLNYQSLKYSLTSTYSEQYSAGGYMALNDSINTTGKGVNLKLGIIACPADFLRLGFSVHTPTLLYMHEEYYSTLNYNSTEEGSISTPKGYSDYQIQTPVTLNTSVAFIIGKKGLVSAEYSWVNYNGTRMLSDDGNAEKFEKENDGVRTNLKNSRTIKLGGEYKITSNISLRAGYANSSIPTTTNASKSMRINTISTNPEYFINDKTNYYTTGFGYREADWFIDFAFAKKMTTDMYYPYNSNELNTDYAVKPAKISSSNNNFVFTLGFKF